MTTAIELSLSQILVRLLEIADEVEYHNSLPFREDAGIDDEAKAEALGLVLFGLAKAFGNSGTREIYPFVQNLKDEKDVDESIRRIVEILEKPTV